MAKDYLSALQAYAANGGKDINEFLAQHTPNVVQPATPDLVKASVPPVATGSVAARIAAADSADRLLGQGAPVAGQNVVTNPTLRPITAESNALAARIAARNAPGGVVPAAGTTPAPNVPVSYGQFGSVGSPVRALAPVNTATAASITAAAPVVGAPAAPTPWWKQSAFANDPGFNSFVNQNNQQAEGRAARDNSFVRLNRNTYFPATQNYNAGSSL